VLSVEDAFVELADELVVVFVVEFAANIAATSAFSRTMDAFLFLEVGETINSEEEVGCVMLIDLLGGTLGDAFSDDDDDVDEEIFVGSGSEIVLAT